MPDSKPIVIICGPTASGKTAAALSLAETDDIEIISADSRQVLKYLDIGTAKPSAEERKKVPHHLIDIIEPGERYTAFRFFHDATACIEEIRKKGNKPVIVGGTGLYLGALTEGIIEIEEQNEAIRQRLEIEMKEIGPEKMHARLARIDPPEAEKIHSNNRVRIIRALEMYELTGRPKSELLREAAHKKSEYNYQQFCISPDRELLYRNINERVERMMAAGLLEELQRLCDKGLKEKIRFTNVIGYKELLDQIDGKLSLEEAVDLIKQNSRRFAKRQLTWFRNRTNCMFFVNPHQLCDVIHSY